jgi:hypothetical protein
LSIDFLTVLARFGCDICATVERIRNFAANAENQPVQRKTLQNMEKCDPSGPPSSEDCSLTGVVISDRRGAVIIDRPARLKRISAPCSRLAPPDRAFLLT